MPDDLVLLERMDENSHVAVLKWNRPDANNAINTWMLKELLAKLNEIEKDISIRVVIMCSEGRHSSFGADLSELIIVTDGGYVNIPKLNAKQHIDDGRLVANKLFHLRVPIIGIIHGFCLGGGAEFYTLCDVLYGASGGKEEGGLMYGFPETTIGVMAGWMGPR